MVVVHDVADFCFFSSRRRHTRFSRDWSSDVCSSDLGCGRRSCRRRSARRAPRAQSGTWPPCDELAAERRSRQEALTILVRQVILTSVAKPSDVMTQSASKDPEVGLRGVASLRVLLEALEE